MLGSFMEEMQITPDQFESACLESKNIPSPSPGVSTFSFHQGLFQQIWAANDYRIFVKMMKQRNVEIQLQALDLIERKQNIAEGDEIKEDGGESLSEDVTKNELDQIEIPVTPAKISEKLIEDMIKEDSQISAEAITDEPIENSDKFQRLNLFFEQEKINAQDIQSRQEYLRAQRDKILQTKKKARARQLNETILKKTERPNSAKVAQKILEDVDKLSENVPVNPHESSLQLRKTLAQRLRAEIDG